MTHTRRELAIDTADHHEAYAVRAAVGQWTIDNVKHGAGATLIETTGYWEGGSATGLRITFDWPHNNFWGHALWHDLLDRVAAAAGRQTLGHETAYRVAFNEINLSERRE